MREIWNSNKFLMWLNNNKFEFLILIFVSIFLYPILNSGYYGDDIYNSAIYGVTIYDGLNINDVYLENLNYWFNQGRVFPVSIATLYVHYFFGLFQNALILYKIYLILLTLINVIVFGMLVQELTNSKTLKLFAMLIAPLFFQIVLEYHNALISYCGLMQITLLFGLLSIYFFLKYLDTKKIIYNVFSTVFVILGLLTYEVGFAFALLLFIISLIKTKSKWIKKSLPQIICVIVVVLINFYARIYGEGSEYVGISMDVSNIPLVAETFFEQFTAVIPGFTALFNPQHTYMMSYKADILDIAVLALFALSSFFICFKQIKNERRFAKQSIILTAVCGLTIWIIPAALIALSKRYQMELSMGIGYLPVYIEYFGLILLIISIVMMILNKLKKINKALVFAIIIIIGMPLLFMNMKTMRNYFVQTRASCYITRDTTISAIEDGFYNGQNEKKILVFDNAGINNSMPEKNIFSMYADRKITAIELNEFADKYVENTNSNGDIEIKENIYVTRITDYTLNNAAIVKGRINKMIMSTEGDVEKTLADDLKLYVRIYDTALSYVLSYDDYNGGKVNKVTKLLDATDFEILRETENDYRLIIDFDDNSVVDINSITFEMNDK